MATPDLKKVKYTLVLKPFAQSDSELLKKVKATLLTDFNLPIYEIQKILENLPGEILTGNDLHAIAEKNVKLLNLGVETSIEKGNFSREAYLQKQQSDPSDSGSFPSLESATEESSVEAEDVPPASDETESPSSSLQDDDDALSLGEKEKEAPPASSSGVQMSTDEATIDEVIEEAAAEDGPMYVEQEDRSLGAQLKKFYQSNRNWLDTVLDLMPMIIIAGVVLFVTNRILLEPPKDPTQTLQEKINELQKKRIKMTTSDFVAAQENAEYSFDASLAILGERVTRTQFRIKYKMEVEPDAEDIILGKDVKTFVRAITLDSELGGKVEGKKVKVETIAKVDIEKAYQIYSEYLDALVEGVISDDRKTFTGRITISEGIPVQDPSKIFADAKINENGSIQAGFNFPLKLDVPPPPPPKPAG